MELLSPAGNIEKLKYAYLYGADAAYIGLNHFSLRAKADNFSIDEAGALAEIKGKKRLYCALNIYFFDEDIGLLRDRLADLKKYPFDAFIVSDIGIVTLLRDNFPDTELHLSTQANCVNSESVKMYRDMGFSRIIPGREMSLKQIERCKRSVPEMELEVFIHGALCVAYSGRCLLSAWMADRSGNRGNCAHACRWEYRLIEEKERPGEYYPVFEDGGFTSLLSSKDLCMIDYLRDLKDAGADSLKIEGRMKSVYYTAQVTRVYRAFIDRLEKRGIPKADQYYEELRKELFKVSHREFCTGFYFGSDEVSFPAAGSYRQNHRFLGIVGKKQGEREFELIVKNKIRTDDAIEYIGPGRVSVRDRSFTIFDESGKAQSEADHGKTYSFTTESEIEEGYLIRSADY
jgi:putative protease